MAFAKVLTQRISEVLVIVVLILFIPGLPPDADFSKYYKVDPFHPFEGKLALNDKLSELEVWHKGDLIGPEAFTDYNGELYTTLHGGDVVKLTGNHITPVVKFGKPCKGIYQESVCGRPLGLEFDRNGNLYVCDAYYGLFKVNVETGDKIKLVSVNQEIDDKKVRLPNSVAVAQNGDLYWTDSSTEFQLEDGIFDLLACGSGRLIHYDAKTKDNKVLIKDLHFANGVVLAEDESFVLVAETARSRIHRYYLKGPKQGTHDIFINGLPGLPDNLKSDGAGGFLVPLVTAVDNGHLLLSQILGPFPYIRKFCARLLGLFELSFNLINRIYPNEYCERGVHFIGHFASGLFLAPNRVTVLNLSKSGEILDSIHSISKNYSGMSEAHIFKDKLYLGSPFNDYIARIPLKKIGWAHLIQQEKVFSKKVQSTSKSTSNLPTTAQKSATTPETISDKTTPGLTTTTQKATTTTTPKPTTTTQKPTTTTTQKPTTTTTPKPTTTATQKPTTTTTPKPTTTTTQKPTTTTRSTTTPRPLTTTSKPTVTSPPTTTTTKLRNEKTLEDNKTPNIPKETVNKL